MSYFNELLSKCKELTLELEAEAAGEGWEPERAVVGLGTDGGGADFGSDSYSFTPDLSAGVGASRAAREQVMYERLERAGEIARLSSAGAGAGSGYFIDGSQIAGAAGVVTMTEISDFFEKDARRYGQSTIVD